MIDGFLDLARQHRQRQGAFLEAPGEGSDRFESETLAFHRTLRQAYLAIAEREPSRCVVLDAAQPPAGVAAAVEAAITAYLRTRTDSDLA